MSTDQGWVGMGDGLHGWCFRRKARGKYNYMDRLVALNVIIGKIVLVICNVPVVIRVFLTLWVCSHFRWHRRKGH